MLIHAARFRSMALPGSVCVPPCWLMSLCAETALRVAWSSLLLTLTTMTATPATTAATTWWACATHATAARRHAITARVSAWGVVPMECLSTPPTRGTRSERKITGNRWR